MARVLSKRGAVLLRRRMAGQHSHNAANRLAFAEFTRHLRAWVDLLLGSLIPGEEKDEILNDTLTEVLSGRSNLSMRIYDSEAALERDLRRLLRERCEVPPDGPRY